MYLLYLAKHGFSEPMPVAVARTKEQLHRYALEQLKNDPDWLGGKLKLNRLECKDGDWVLEDDVGEVWGWIWARVKFIDS